MLNQYSEAVDHDLHEAGELLLREFGFVGEFTILISELDDGVFGRGVAVVEVAGPFEDC